MSAMETLDKILNYADVLENDGIEFENYFLQISFLIFLKIEYERQIAGEESTIPRQFSWPELCKLEGSDLEVQYRDTLEIIERKGGNDGDLVINAQTRIKDPSKLEELIRLIQQEEWSTLESEVGDDIFEGLFK